MAFPSSKGTSWDHTLCQCRTCHTTRRDASSGLRIAPYAMSVPHTIRYVSTGLRIAPYALSVPDIATHAPDRRNQRRLPTFAVQFVPRMSVFAFDLTWSARKSRIDCT
eukprot:262416-Rhodomonas_salina.2